MILLHSGEISWLGMVSFGDGAGGMAKLWRERLKRALEASGRSLRSVALEAGLSPGYLNHILRDEKDPAFDKVVAICKALGISVGDLVKNDDQDAEKAEVLEIWASLSKEERKALLQVFARAARQRRRPR